MNRFALCIRASITFLGVLALVGIPLAAQAATPLTITTERGYGRPGLTNVGSRLYVGWAGTNGTTSARPINMGYSDDGGQTIHKVTYTDTTVNNEGPAVANLDGTVYLAWAGTNSTHNITVGYYDGSSSVQCHTILADTSTHAPSLVVYRGTMYMAWIGTTNNHIYFAQILPCSNGQVALQNREAVGDSSNAGPSLVTFNDKLYVGWSGTDSATHINIGQYNGSTSLQNKAELSSTSADGVGLTVAPNTNPAKLYLAYRGTESAHHLWEAQSTDGVAFTGNTATNDAAAFGISLAGDTQNVHSAFIGTDPSSTLNIGCLTC